MENKTVDNKEISYKMDWPANQVYDYVHNESLLLGHTHWLGAESIDIKAKKLLKKKPKREFIYNNHKIGLIVEEHDFIIYIDKCIILCSYHSCGADYLNPWRTVVNWLLCYPGASTPPFFICMIDTVIGRSEYYANGYRYFEIIGESEYGWNIYQRYGKDGATNGWFNKNKS